MGDVSLGRASAPAPAPVRHRRNVPIRGPNGVVRTFVVTVYNQHRVRVGEANVPGCDPPDTLDAWWDGYQIRMPTDARGVLRWLAMVQSFGAHADEALRQLSDAVWAMLP
jgi:hypothetical protein